MPRGNAPSQGAENGFDDRVGVPELRVRELGIAGVADQEDRIDDGPRVPAHGWRLEPGVEVVLAGTHRQREQGRRHHQTEMGDLSRLLTRLSAPPGLAVDEVPGVDGGFKPHLDERRSLAVDGSAILEPGPFVTEITQVLGAKLRFSF